MFYDSTPAVREVTLSIPTDNTRVLRTIPRQYCNRYCVCVFFARSRENNRILVWHFVTGSRKNYDTSDSIFHRLFRQ